LLSLQRHVSCELGDDRSSCANHLLNGPRQCAYNIDAVFVDALEHFAQEVLVVEGTFEVVALGFDRLEGISGCDVGSR
jgi:hypothetical protein